MIAASFPEIAIVPDVLADAHADASFADVQNLRTAERLEVSVFVEHVVGREECLAEPMMKFAALQENRAVVERAPDVGHVRFGQPDENGRTVSQLARKVRGPFPAATDERGAEQQVARKIADECEFRADGELRARARSLSRGGDDELRVAVEVSDRRIDLKQRDFHGVGRSATR